MTPRVVEATAPTRIDLAGGTLDLWPLYLFHPGAWTVNVAIDRRAHCRIETGIAGVRVESKDTLRKAEGKDVAEVLAQGGSAALPCHILRALGVETGVRVVTHSRVPAGSGLGGSSALAVAIAAAAARAFDRDLGDSLVPLVRDAEAQAIGVPTGTQDHYAAVHGGVLGIELRPGQPQVERIATDPGRVEEALLLVDAGVVRFSGINNWAVFKAQIDGDAAVREALGRIGAVAGRVREALVERRFADVAGLIDEEWEARKRLAAEVTTPEIDRIAEAARSAGGAAKVCGAGGGGMVAVWAPPGDRGPGTRERVVGALAQAGFKPVPFRVDLRGLEVE